MLCVRTRPFYLVETFDPSKTTSGLSLYPRTHVFITAASTELLSLESSSTKCRLEPSNFNLFCYFRRARIETVGTCSKSKLTSNEHKYIRDMVQVNQFRGAKGSKPLPCDAKTGLLTQDKLVKRKKAVSTISSYRSITEALARSFGSDLKSAPRQHGLETRFIDRF